MISENLTSNGAPKKRKVHSENDINVIPSSVMCSFSSQEGTRAGPTIELPSTSTLKQLEELVNTLLNNSDKVNIRSSISSGHIIPILFCSGSFRTHFI